MKKFTRNIIAFVVILALLSMTMISCTPRNNNDKVSIVVTNACVYNWVCNIIGDEADITLLNKTGVEMHSFQPSFADIVQIKSADIFIYIGGESEKWVSDAISDIGSDKLAINLLDSLGDKALAEEEIGEEEHDHDEDELELDEHIWLSLRNASFLTKHISKSICSFIKNEQTKGENNKFYRFDTAKIETKTLEYAMQIDALDEHFTNEFEGADKVVIADRFPFIYLMTDYQIPYEAAFSGCSSETNASFETVTRLANALLGLEHKCLVVLDGSGDSLATTVALAAGETNVPFYVVNSLQSVRLEQISDNFYLDAMADALTELCRAAKGANNVNP